jgi:hypothetical protein
MANKADPRIDSDNSRYEPTSTTGRHDYASENHGPHSSTTGNRVDPRIDSDNSRFGATTTSTGQHGIGSDSYGRHNEHNNTTSGPHASNMANKADPRIDSDNSRLAGGVGGSHGQFANTAASGQHGYERTPGAFPTGDSGLGSNNNTFTGYGSNTSGPHSSDLSNRADPRIDSDNSRHAHPSGLSSQPHGTSTTAGQNFSGRDPYASTSSTTRDPYSSTSHATGPHNSEMLNKLDPRVDSDSRNHGHGSTDSGRQTGGLVGGPHGRLENPEAVPTAGGLPVGAEGHGIYDSSSSHAGLTGSHGGLTGSHSGPTASHGGLTGSHNGPTASHGGLAGSHNGPTASHGLTGSNNGLTGSHGGLTGSHSGPTASHGGLTGSHNRDQYDSHSRTNEPYGSSVNGSHGIGGSHNIGPTGTTTGAYGSTNSGPHSSNLSNKVDPRVDSDNDRLRGPDSARDNYGSSGHGIGSSGVGSGVGLGSGNHTSGLTSGHTSGHTGNHNAHSDLEYKERELALRQKELDLKEREHRVNAGY